MRAHVVYTICVLICLLALGVRAEDTNNAFWPQDVGGLYDDKDRAERNAKAREESVRTGEYRPAELDPEGHWGPIIYGQQLSIRAQTNVFILGESIPMSVIVRNTTTNEISLYELSRGTETAFGIKLESGRVLPAYVLGTSFFGFKPLAAKHQIKYDYDVAQYVPQQPGIYQIFAEQTIVDSLKARPRMSTRTNLDSGMITIKVVPK